MCDAASAALATVSLVTQAMMQKGTPKLELPEVPKAPQEAKFADTTTAKAKTSNTRAGLSATMATGVAGVPTSALSLGSNSLLGL